MTDEQADLLAQQLESHPDYRVLPRLEPRKTYAKADGRVLSRGVIVDTETTGLNLLLAKGGIASGSFSCFCIQP